MKKLILIAALLVGCAGKDGQKPYEFFGQWGFNDRFCGDINGAYFNCVQALKPVACAGTTLYSVITIDVRGQNIMFDGVNYPMTSNGNQISATSGPTFTIKRMPQFDSLVFVMAPGCELEFKRR